MKKLILALAFVACGLFSATSQAGVQLADYRLNVDGVTSYTAAGVNLAGFSTTTGLGTITATFTSPGAHYFGLFVDHEIDETINGFINEIGSVTGAPASGQSWEIDEPGFVLGNIFANFGASSLDNTNNSTLPDDVSMALAWNFTLLADEQATITMLVSQTAPLSGFYLTHTDPNSNSSIYFSSGLSIVPTGGGVVPEPSSWLIILGLVGVSMKIRRRVVKN